MPFGRYQACEIIHTKVLDHQLFISFLIKNSFKEMKSKEHDHHLIFVTVQTKDKKQLFLLIIHPQLSPLTPVYARLDARLVCVTVAFVSRLSSLCITRKGGLRAQGRVDGRPGERVRRRPRRRTAHRLARRATRRARARSAVTSARALVRLSVSILARANLSQRRRSVGCATTWLFVRKKRVHTVVHTRV